MADFSSLPPDLPEPIDDGAANHLEGSTVPRLTVASTAGAEVDLRASSSWTVIYAYPMTGKPGAPLPPGWNEFPGARGCTPQSCSFRDRYTELAALGARVVGLSSSSLEFQREAKQRLALPFELLADPELEVAEALRLPTFTLGGATYYKRLTMLIRDDLIKKVFYPVFPPHLNASDVVAWLRDSTGDVQSS